MGEEALINSSKLKISGVFSAAPLDILKNMALASKPFSITLTAIAIIELVSLSAQIMPVVGTIGFLLAMFLTLILTLNKLEYGLYIILAELFVGSQGHLLDAHFNNTNISLRIGLFIVVLSVWAWQRLKNRNFSLIKNKIWNYYLALFLFIAISLIQGLAINDFGNVFFDVNAWLYFALGLAFFDIANPKFFNHIIQILLAGTSWLAVKTVFILVLFSHGLAEIGDPIYQWIRDTRIGEITFVSGTIFRIFFQSQIYILIGFLVVLALLITKWPELTKKARAWLIVYLYLTGLAIIISQSRSFWVGGVVAIFSLLILLSWQQKIKLKIIGLSAVLLIVLIVLQIFSLQLITGNITGNIVGDRFKDLKAEAAGISRINQLEPLTYNIGQRLIFGYGFGKTLTYKSSDPRVLADHPDGIYTTYAFEWGYLDIALKIGIIGLLIYLALAFKIIKKGITSSDPLIIGLLAGLIMLLVTNIFSPYLNHPLGIGYIILLSLLIFKNHEPVAKTI